MFEYFVDKSEDKTDEILLAVCEHLLNELKDVKEFSILSSLLLRSMQKAVYDKSNIGHFGLASKCYTHFTSPIRRFPDTTVHNLLRKYIFNEPDDKELNKRTFIRKVDDLSNYMNFLNGLEKEEALELNDY